jgi:hypothetical protein
MINFNFLSIKLNLNIIIDDLLLDTLMNINRFEIKNL